MTATYPTPNQSAPERAKSSEWQNQYERTTIDARAMTNREIAQCLVAGTVIGSLTLRQDAAKRALRDEATRRHMAIVDRESA